MELYYSFSVLIVLASLFSYANHRFLKLPSSIGIMLMAIIASVVIRFGGNYLFPNFTDEFYGFLNGLDFTELLMGAMLNFLLFAGAIHVKFADLKEQRIPVLLFSTVSVIMSTFIVGFLIYYISQWMSIDLPLMYCLLFGALISPTDPIAVLGILKSANVPKSVETKIAGEALFNDGVAVVLFAVLLQLCQTPGMSVSMENISFLLLKEAGGGLLLGGLLGFSASAAMKQIDDYVLSALITLSVVMGGYLIAHALHFSSPLTMVAAGLIIGNFGKKVAMSKTTQEYLSKFWELIDEILNSVLFLFIGFELLMIEDIKSYWILSLIAIGVVLLARTLSIVIPSSLLPIKSKFTKGSLTLMVWGGLRGGVSIALVLMVSNNHYREILLELTYFVVIFSILVQGLTVGKVAKKLFY